MAGLLVMMLFNSFNPFAIKKLTDLSLAGNEFIGVPKKLFDLPLDNFYINNRFREMKKLK